MARLVRGAGWLGSLVLGLGVAAGWGLPLSAAVGAERTYYIAAEEVTWNFAPAGEDLMMGMPFDDEQKTYVERGAGRIGSSYKMAV